MIDGERSRWTRWTGFHSTWRTASRTLHHLQASKDPVLKTCNPQDFICTSSLASSTTQCERIPQFIILSDAIYTWIRPSTKVTMAVSSLLVLWLQFLLWFKDSYDYATKQYERCKKHLHKLRQHNQEFLPAFIPPGTMSEGGNWKNTSIFDHQMEDPQTGKQCSPTVTPTRIFTSLPYSPTEIEYPQPPQARTMKQLTGSVPPIGYSIHGLPQSLPLYDVIRKGKPTRPGFLPLPDYIKDPLPDDFLTYELLTALEDATQAPLPSELQNLTTTPPAPQQKTPPMPRKRHEEYLKKQYYKMFGNVMPYPKSSQTTKDAATQTSEEDTTTSTISTQTSSSEILHGAFDYASTLPHFYTQSSVIPSNLNITEIPATNPIYHFQLGLSLPTQATQKPRDSPVSPHIIIGLVLIQISGISIFDW